MVKEKRYVKLNNIIFVRNKVIDRYINIKYNIYIPKMKGRQNKII